MSETTTSILGECAHCGKKINCGTLFCSHECKINFDRRKQLDVLKHKKQKHEEIKQMAWEVYKEALKMANLPNNIKKINSKLNCAFDNAWELARHFHYKAKEKEEGTNELL